MMKRVVALSIAGLTIGLGATTAAADETKPSSCAMVRSIDSWKPIDDENAYIYTSPRRKFKVKFFAPCRELKWALFARVETRPSSAMCLSVGDTLVFGRGSVMPSQRWQFEERCTITAIEGVPYDAKEPLPDKPAAPPPP